jgi:uncharacterized protein (TIGR02588 family)
MSQDSKKNESRDRNFRQEEKVPLNNGDREVTAIQWAIGGVSTLLVLMLLGFIFYEAVTGTDIPPILSVRQERILPVDQGFIVEFTAKNTGGVTAKNVTIEGVLTESGKAVEKSNATISFVPSHAERDGGLVFSHDPRRYKLEIQPKGYDRP